MQWLHMCVYIHRLHCFCCCWWITRGEHISGGKVCMGCVNHYRNKGYLSWPRTVYVWNRTRTTWVVFLLTITWTCVYLCMSFSVFFVCKLSTLRYIPTERCILSECTYPGGDNLHNTLLRKDPIRSNVHPIRVLGVVHTRHVTKKNKYSTPLAT